MTIPPAPQGWTRFLVKSKFAAGRDFAVLDPQTEEQLFFIDGKMGPRPKADVLDAQGQPLYHVTGRLLGIPKRMTITDLEGTEVATLKAKAFSPIKARMTLELSDDTSWSLEGSFIEKNYSIKADDKPVVEITQKWVTIRDTYTLDIADGADPGFALAVLWAVDRWVERD
jgi:uncharacterized protein YxjI